MSKFKLGFSALFMLVFLSMFAAIASAEEFTPTPGNPAPGINVGTIDNHGATNQHKTHGNFQNNTNSCANCHSTHQGDSATLLKFEETESDLCFSCHDGTLGFYNVTSTDSRTGKHGKTAGGGVFNDDKTASGSMHNVGTASIGGAPGMFDKASKGITDELQCSSCHNPHGTANDRLLKSTVIGQNYTGQPEGTKVISLALTPDPEYADINSSSTNSGLVITTSIGPNGNTDKTNYAKFCGSCHDDYLASSGQVTKSGHYTHTANSSSAGRNCASCHYAHGTDNTLLKDTIGRNIFDLQKPVNQGGEGFSEATAKAYMKDVNPSSSLKKYTNMVVCYTCHTSSHIEALEESPMPTQAYDGQYWKMVFSSRDNKFLPNFNGKAGIR